MEFHLPYFAIHQGRQMTDQRKLRRYYPMINRIDEPVDDLFYYEAQISFLITGVDEWYWTAYCCVDTFFGSEQSLDEYLACEDDGPSGGGRSAFFPAWNPREYFLIVLSRRFMQVTQEWRNLIDELNLRLDTYVSLVKS